MKPAQMPCSCSCTQTALPVGRGTQRLDSHDPQIIGHVRLLTGASDDRSYLGSVWVANHSALSTSSTLGGADVLATRFPFHVSHSCKAHVRLGWKLSLKMSAWDLPGLSPCAPHASSTTDPQEKFLSGIRKNLISLPAIEEPHCRTQSASSHGQHGAASTSEEKQCSWGGQAMRVLPSTRCWCSAGTSCQGEHPGCSAARGGAVPPHCLGTGAAW